jgi:hypothetical protein
MPEYHNNTLVVTYDELIPELMSYEALKKALTRAKKRKYGITTLQRGGGLNHKSLILFDSLPANIREKLDDPRRAAHPLDQFFAVDFMAIDWYNDYRLDDGSSLSDEAKDKYIANASLLNACKMLKEARERQRISQGGSTRGVLQTIWEDSVSFIPEMRKRYALEASLPGAYPRWVETYNRFHQQSYISLVSKKHGNANASKSSNELVKLLNDMFAGQSNKPTFAEISRQYEAFITGYLEVINGETGEMYSPVGYPALSRSTIYNYLNEYESRIGTFAKRSGDRQKLMGASIPYHSLLHPEWAGSIISIDDRQPPFEYAKGQRMWFYNGIDLGSEAFTCWVYGKTKEGIILEFYRQMIRNYAEWGFQLPAELECESSLNSSFADTFLRPGYMFQHVRIEANNARGKRIEAYYNPLRYQLEKKHAEWLARPFALSESNQAGPEKTESIPYDKLADQCLGDIETWNNMPHSIYKDKTRWEVFCERQNPNLKPTNYKSFLRHLGHKTQAKVKAGLMKFQYREWVLGDDSQVFTGERLINLMKIVEGEQVDIYYLDDNHGGILKALIYLQDTYVCEAIAKPVYHRATIEMTEADYEAREIMSKYAVTIESFQRRQKNALEPVTIIDNRPITLNNKFKIPGRKTQPQVTDQKVEIMPEPAEAFEIDSNELQSGFVTSLKDRF